MFHSMDLLTCDLPGIKKLRSGKVREVFDLGKHLLLVATDRISAFDRILPNAIPGKGEFLTLSPPSGSAVSTLCPTI